MSNNYALKGGGVHVKGSTIVVHQRGTLSVSKNEAVDGSGMYLEENPKLYLLKNDRQPNISYHEKNMLIFSGNQASYGGAVYVADDNNAGACTLDVDCFIQTLALHQLPPLYIITENIIFSENDATESGPNLFGGLLDRCVPSSFAEIYHKQHHLRTQHYDGVRYLQHLSNITLDSISSAPVKICFCTADSEPSCGYQPVPIFVKKGETFNVSLVAVDQVNHPVHANIISSLASPDGGLSEGQHNQPAGNNCSNLTYNVFSSRNYDSINIHAEGPCGKSKLSVRNLDIQFLNCTCPLGFQPYDAVDAFVILNCLLT